MFEFQESGYTAYIADDGQMRQELKDRKPDTNIFCLMTDSKNIFNFHYEFSYATLRFFFLLRSPSAANKLMGI